MLRIWNESLTVLALAFLVAYSYPAFTSEISPHTQIILDAVQWKYLFSLTINGRFNCRSCFTVPSPFATFENRFIWFTSYSESGYW